jgi:hypothetical protein
MCVSGCLDPIRPEPKALVKNYFQSRVNLAKSLTRQALSCDKARMTKPTYKEFLKKCAKQRAEVVRLRGQMSTSQVADKLKISRQRVLQILKMESKAAAP